MALTLPVLNTTALTETGGDPVVTKYYFHAGKRVAMRKDNVLYYLVGDHLGTTSVVLNANGTVHSQARHYPYGEERWSSGTLPTDYRFTGQRQDSGLGLYFMGARQYDPTLGRWLSADTLVPKPANPLSYNRYSWVLGNPLKFVDPTGHKETACDGAPEVCQDDELYESHQFYCSENPDSEYCQPSMTYGEAFVTFVVTVTAAELLIGAFELGSGFIVDLVTASATAACADGDCTNEVNAVRKSSYQIGAEGQRLVKDFLNDPTAQEEVWVWVGEAGKRANQLARLDIVTETAIHEVKNVAQLSLSQQFREQAMRYYQIAEGAGLELHYWLINSAPQKVSDWLEELGAIVHTGIPGQ